MNSRAVNVALVGLNLGLVGTIAYLLYLLRLAPVAATPPAKPKVVTNTVTQIAVRKINATNLLAALANRTYNWAGLESSNYRAFMANLRAFGCPEETIRDIILTDIARAYAKRRTELRAQAQAQPATAAGETNAAGEELRADLAQLDREQRALVKALLGVDFQTEMSKYWDAGQYAERAYGFLSPDKREKLLALLEKFDQMEHAVYQRTKGELTEEHLVELQQLEELRRSELTGLLTPEELAQYDMRFSGTAEALRAQLGGFETTEEEFRQMFELQRVLENQEAQAEQPTEEQQTQEQARIEQRAEDLYEEELKRIFGERRYGEWLRWQDQDYQAMIDMADRGLFPRDVANKVYDMRQEAERQKLAVQEDPNLSDAQRQSALRAITYETEKSLSGVMGQRNYQRYRRTAGQWLGDLSVTQPVAPAGAAGRP